MTTGIDRWKHGSEFHSLDYCPGHPNPVSPWDCDMRYAL